MFTVSYDFSLKVVAGCQLMRTVEILLGAFTQETLVLVIRWIPSRKQTSGR